jgi:hypothetical protein
VRSETLTVALLAIACSGPAADSLSVTDAGSGSSLTGAWDASLSLVRAYPLAAGSPDVGRICGTIGFVENRHSNASENGAESIGVYDLDLRRIGLNWLGDTAFPEALASGPHRTPRVGPISAPDSVTIVLNPGSRERIVLLGERDNGGIAGDWVAQSARGTSTGHFSLRPHAASQRSC